jgi:integrase
MSVRKDPRRAGRWLFVFTSIHPRPDGGRRQIFRSGFPTQAAAKAAERVAIDEDKSFVSRDGALTVSDVVNTFIRAKRLAGKAPGTIAFYERIARHALDRWGGWPADSLTFELLDAAYLEMLSTGRRQHRRGKGVEVTSRPLKPRTVQALHKLIKAAYSLAVDQRRLVHNPARLATAPSLADRPDRQWWTPTQVGTFLTHVANLGDKAPTPLALVECLADTGGRRGETLGLRWSDVDLDASTVRITRQLSADPTTKALSMRPPKRPRSKATIGLHPSTVAALRRRRAQQAEHRLAVGAGWPGAGHLAEDLVFTWPSGEPIHPDILTRTIARLSVAAKLPRLTPHGLRHSFASAALAAGVAVEVVAHRLGNTVRVTQEIYAHAIPAEDQAAAQLVGDLYRQPV